MPEFDERSIERIVNAVRYVEGQPRNSQIPTQGAKEIPWDRLGITTTSITARSSKTPGTGTVQPYYYDRVTNLLVSTGSTVTIKNWTGSVIPTNVWVEYRVIDGMLFYVGNDCSGVAP